jgi:hypothetical protein
MTKISFLVLIFVLVGGLITPVLAADFKAQAKEVLTGVVEKDAAAGDDFKDYQKKDTELRYFRLRVTSVERSASGLKSGNVVQVLYYHYLNNPSVIPVEAEEGMVLKIWANPANQKWNLILASNGEAVNLVREKVAAGPELVIDSPKDSAEFDYNRVVIKGKTETGATLLVNGLIINLSGDGRFETPVYLSAYRNIFSLVAIGKNGGETRKSLTLIYKGATLSSQLQLEKTIQSSVDKALKGETFDYLIALVNKGSEEIVDLRLTLELSETVSLVETTPRFDSASGKTVVIDLPDNLKKNATQEITVRVRVNDDVPNGANLPLKAKVTGSNNTRTDNLAEDFEDAGPLLVRSKGGFSIWTILIPLLVIFYILISLGSGFLIAKHLVKRSISKT